MAIAERGGEHVKVCRRIRPIHRFQVGMPQDERVMRPASSGPERRVIAVESAGDTDDDRGRVVWVGWRSVFCKQSERQLVAVSHDRDLLLVNVENS